MSMKTATFICNKPRESAARRELKALYADNELAKLTLTIARNRATANGTSVDDEMSAARQVARNKVGNISDWLRS